MSINHPDSTKNYNRLFHISEEEGIAEFVPRPSPSHFDELTGDVVFAISQKLLHNYLLPRDCPRVTYYLSEKTTAEDKDRFFGTSKADHIVIVESGWYERIKQTRLICYEFPAERFSLLDECAGYYVSYHTVAPIKVTVIEDILSELLSRNIELRFTPSLIQLAESVAQSSLNFSIIRMRNAKR